MTGRFAGRKAARQVGIAVLLLAGLLATPASAAPAPDPGASHPGDYRTCKVCAAALEKSFGYVKSNLGKSVLANTWYAEFLGAFHAGFAFLAEGNSPTEAKQCADHICKYFDWARRHGGYEGWFCSMAMLYLTEYSLRYGATPEIAAKLEWGAKWAHKTREKEGGWFHGPRWGQGNYALDISSVGCGYFMALEEMKALGLQTGPALGEAREYVEMVCDNRSVAYGLWGRGGFSLGASAYVFLGLTSTGQLDDPRVAGIGGFLKENYRDIRKAHACGNLHHFGVAAALHRVGPEAYGRFAQYYLHEMIIPNMRADGTIAAFPNDDAGEARATYAKLKDGSDYVGTAILATMILLERPGAFSPLPSKKRGMLTNKEAFRIATEALAKGDIPKAYKHFVQVLPMADADELVPQAQEQIRKIEAPLRQRLKDARAQEERDLAQAKTLADAGDYRGAVQAYDGLIKMYDEIAKEFAGIPVAQEAKTSGDLLRKASQGLRTKAAFSGGAAAPAPASGPAATTAPAAAGGAAPAPGGKLKNPETLKIWEERLKERVRTLVKGGVKVRGEIRALGGRVAIVGADDLAGIRAMIEGGGQVDLAWSRLQPADWRSLAVGLAEAQDTPEDHALAAFYRMAAGEGAKAQNHLARAGTQAAAVRDAFAE
jgi:hypothetical protein